MELSLVHLTSLSLGICSKCKENQGPKQVTKSSLKYPRPKGGKDGQRCQGELSCKDSYHIKIDHVRGEQEARVSSVL